MGVVVVTDRKDPNLDRREPCGKCAGIVLEKNAKETLDRAEQCPMQHDRTLARTVGRNVFKVESIGKVEVTLNSAQLPRASDCVLDVDIDLRAIERSIAFFDRILETIFLKRTLKGVCGLVPDLIATDMLVGIFRTEVGGELGKAERAQDTHDEIKKRCDFVLQFFFGAIDMTVVLSEAPNSHKPMQRSCPLVSVHGAKFEKAKRKFAIASLPASIDKTVHRAIHGLRVVRTVVHFHGRVHPVLIEIKMP